MIRMLFAIAAGLPLLPAAAATTTRAGFAPAYSVTACCGGRDLGLQAQLQVTV